MFVTVQDTGIEFATLIIEYLNHLYSTHLCRSYCRCALIFKLHPEMSRFADAFRDRAHSNFKLMLNVTILYCERGQVLAVPRHSCVCILWRWSVPRILNRKGQETYLRYTPESRAGRFEPNGVYIGSARC